MNSTLLLGLMPLLCWLLVTPLSPAQCLPFLIYCSQSLFYSPASAHGRCLLGNLVKQRQVAANLGETEGLGSRQPLSFLRTLSSGEPLFIEHHC